MTRTPSTRSFFEKGTQRKCTETASKTFILYNHAQGCVYSPQSLAPRLQPRPCTPHEHQACTAAQPTRKLSSFSVRQSTIDEPKEDPQPSQTKSPPRETPSRRLGTPRVHRKRQPGGGPVTSKVPYKSSTHGTQPQHMLSLRAKSGPSTLRRLRAEALGGQARLPKSETPLPLSHVALPSGELSPSAEQEARKSFATGAQGEDISVRGASGVCGELRQATLGKKG